MISTEKPLSGAHLRTYEKIFQHPISHSVEWREALALLARLGETVKEQNGSLRVTRNGHVLVVREHRPGEGVDVESLMEIRHFLKRADTAVAAPSEKETHWLVVIDHHEARIFRSVMQGSVPRQVVPHKPGEFFRHAHNSKDFSRGREKPDPNSFFEPVARELGDFGAILVMGSGKGTGSEMMLLLPWLAEKHPEISRRVIGSVVVDQHHLTEAQLLKAAQEFYTSELTEGLR